jgi:hypothetical protein
VITGVTSHVLQVDGIAHVISDDGYEVLRNSSRGLDGLGGPVKPGAGPLPAALITAESADDHYVIGMRPNRLKRLRPSFRQFTPGSLTPGDEAVPVASARSKIGERLN